MLVAVIAMPTAAWQGSITGIFICRSRRARCCAMPAQPRIRTSASCSLRNRAAVRRRRSKVRSGSLSSSMPRSIERSPAIRAEIPSRSINRAWRATDAGRIDKMPMCRPWVSAVTRADSAIPKVGRCVVARISVRPGSEKQAFTKAAVFLSSERTNRHKGSITASTSASVSIPGGPSAKVWRFDLWPAYEPQRGNGGIDISCHSLAAVWVDHQDSIAHRAGYSAGGSAPVCEQIRP